MCVCVCHLLSRGSAEEGIQGWLSGLGPWQWALAYLFKRRDSRHTLGDEDQVAGIVSCPERVVVRAEAINICESLKRVVTDNLGASASQTVRLTQQTAGFDLRLPT